MPPGRLLPVEVEVMEVEEEVVEVEEMQPLPRASLPPSLLRPVALTLPPAPSRGDYKCAYATMERYECYDLSAPFLANCTSDPYTSLTKLGNLLSYCPFWHPRTFYTP